MGETAMLAKVLLLGLYAYAIHFVVQAAYVTWQVYRNDALPGFRLHWKPDWSIQRTSADKSPGQIH
jgi:hypothetical protein